MKHIQLFEYFDSNVSDLMRYLRMSEEQKKESIVETYPNLAGRYNFYEDKYDEIEDVCEDMDALEALYDEFEDEDYTIVEHLKEDYPDVYKLLLDYAYDAVKYGDAVPDEQKPSWVYLDFENIIKKDTWLVHLTSKEAAYDILKNGFTKGVNDLTTLGLTTMMGDSEKAYGGYNFAYTIPDFIRYARNSSSNEMFRYGNTILMFRAAGVRCRHSSDEEYQVIFYGETATDIKRIYHDEDYADRNIGELDINQLFMKADNKAIAAFIKSRACGYSGNVLVRLRELAATSGGLVKLKQEHLNAWRDVFDYFSAKIETEGQWYVLNSQDNIAYRAHEAEDLLIWFQQNYRQVK